MCFLASIIYASIICWYYQILLYAIFDTQEENIQENFRLFVLLTQLLSFVLRSLPIRPHSLKTCTPGDMILTVSSKPPKSYYSVHIYFCSNIQFRYILYNKIRHPDFTHAKENPIKKLFTFETSMDIRFWSLSSGRHMIYDTTIN